ncbi:TPA: DUF4153 domain-containing protein [Kluyvera georgiana]|uniref:Putative transport protein n=1 Tax=Kluyvera georgiana ATCC 51603 TaxID=1354264 RepID=A0A1B7K7H6_9ENTR|nr:DUF4153 domain-containing protein [Kluyvera georgiana]OAT56080.1 putative transport protein [Kluyvera georgiana ATCC 51603]
MDTVTPLSSPTRWGMVLTGLVQGLLCYLLVTELIPHPGWWIFYGLPGSLALSSVLLFSVISFRQRALWGWLAVILAVVLAMSGWLKSNLNGDDSWRQYDALFRYGWCLLLMALMILPWIQFQLHPHPGSYRYVHFYDQQWQNALTLLLIGVANGLVWLIFLLWSGLFELANITFFSHLFFETEWFIYLVIGLVTALTVILARQNVRLVSAIHKLLTLLATGLLPLVSLLAILFLVTLAFTGLTVISQRVSAALLLITLALSQLLLTAMVWQPQQSRLSYPRPLRYLIITAMVLTPVYAAIAGWALWMRIGQYGWTAERLHGTLVVVVLLVWSLGYVLSLLRRREDPSPQMGKVHLAVSLLALALLILLYTPLLDSGRISVNSHMARYHQGKINADQVSLYMLSHSGKPGREALLMLQKDPQFIQDAKRQRELKRLLNGDRSPLEKMTSPMLENNVVVAPGSLVPDAALWAAIIERRYLVESCSEVDSCVLVSQDLNGDGNAEQVLYAFGDRTVLVFSQGVGRWEFKASATLPAGVNKEKLLRAVAEGKVGAKPKAWQDMTLGDETVVLEYRR